MIVLALSDSLAPWHSFWIRVGQYLPALARPTQITAEASAVERLGAGDCLILYRYALEWGDLAGRLFHARQRGVMVVSDVDDYLWQASSWTRERLLGYTRALRQCHAISCSTLPLLEQMEVLLPGVRLQWLPNTAPRAVPTAVPQSAQERPIGIGWTGAPWTRLADLQQLRPLAAWISDRPRQLRLVHVGHSERHLSLADALEIDPALVTTYPLQGHADYLQNFHFQIGLAPLATNTFNYYKSPIKVLEYSGAGIPWLAADAEPYRDLCRAWGLTDRLCGSGESWIERLQPLLQASERLAQGAALQRLCWQHASFQSGVEAWDRLLRSV